jgi:hypothetical protein
MEEFKPVEKKSKLVILAVAGILLFLIGAALGFVLHTQNKIQVQKVEAINSLSSKVVSSMSASGKVKNISGRNITLTNLGDDLTITIADNAQIYSFTLKTKGAAQTQQTAKFGDIKVGDNINVAVKLSPTGQMQGASVVILPVK